MPAPASSPPPSPLRLRAKLWRYLSYGWLLERPPGDLFGAYACRRANRERLSRWLPRYLRVYAALTVLAGLGRESIQGLGGGNVPLVLSSLTLCVTAGALVVTACAYLALSMGERFGLYD